MRFNFAKFQFFMVMTILLSAGLIFSIYSWVNQYGAAELPVVLIAPMAVAYVALLAYMAWMWLVVTAPKKRLIDELRRQCKTALSSDGAVATGRTHTGVTLSLKSSGKRAYLIELKSLGGGRAAWLVDPHQIERAEMDGMTPVVINPMVVEDVISILKAYNARHLTAEFVLAEDKLVKEKLEQLRSMPIPVVYESTDAAV